MSGGNESLNALVEWMGTHPEEVERWMTDQQFRQDLLANPQQFGLTGSALDWVNERLRLRSMADVVGFIAPF
jgi:hypothetical protein